MYREEIKMILKKVMADNKTQDMKTIILWNSKVLHRWIYEIYFFYTGVQTLLITSKNVIKAAKDFHLVPGLSAKIICNFAESYCVPILIS